MYWLTFEKRVWIVKQIMKGISPAKVASSQQVSDRTVRSLVVQFKQFGWDGLRDHKTGRPETVLNENVAVVILDLRQRFGYGACRIEQLLKQKGFSISHRQIEKLLVRNNFVVPNIKKQRSRKWVRYELPNPNDLWHTDWSHDPFTDKELCAYIDDKTRLITAFGLFQHATTDNTLAVLKTGIGQHGKPKAIMTDHGSTYYANHPGADQEHTQFRIALDALGIKHVLARINRPQTNGKIERWFGTYKQEFMTSTFIIIQDYVQHYNNDRPHMSLNYRTPHDVWRELTNRK
ncbi:MAG: DDE-type integrase/transposase/recombinase [Candidatus Woesearchaeota archaeon]|nr:DDE-type integrase/transposase/recombinase [Candidatus Woesearchaeota archaeon]